MDVIMKDALTKCAKGRPYAAERIPKIKCNAERRETIRPKSFKLYHENWDEQKKEDDQYECETSHHHALDD